MSRTGDKSFLDLVEKNPSEAVKLYQDKMREREQEQAKASHNPFINTTLLETARKYQESTGITTEAFAKAIEVSRAYLSQYLSGSYQSNPKNIETKLYNYLTAQGSITENSVEAAHRLPDFHQTKDAMNILGVCSSSQESNGLGVIVGKSGLGKSYTLQYYTKKSKVAYIECDDSMNTTDLITAIENALGMPKGVTSTFSRAEMIKSYFRVNPGYLLIIDEADKLISKHTQRKAEILRALFDQSSFGMILAGEPVLESKIKSFLPRLANRVDFYACLRGVTKQEVLEYVKDYNFSDEAKEELYWRAANNQNGCFRLLHRTMKNITRIIEPGELVTIETIREASAMMML